MNNLEKDISEEMIRKFEGYLDVKSEYDSHEINDEEIKINNKTYLVSGILFSECTYYQSATYLQPEEYDYDVHFELESYELLT